MDDDWRVEEGEGEGEGGRAADAVDASCGGDDHDDNGAADCRASGTTACSCASAAV